MQTLNAPPANDLINQDAEKALLSSILRNQLDVSEFLKYVRSEKVFSLETNQTIYQALKSLHGQGKRTGGYDVLMACRGIMPDVAWGPLIADIKHADTSSSPIEVALYLTELSARRYIISQGSRLARRMGNLDNDVFAEAENTRKVLEQFMIGITSINQRDNQTIKNEWWNERINIKAGNYQPGLKTGLRALDYVFKGIMPTESVVIAARPGMGKTALACQFIYNISVIGGIYGAFMSLEMKDKQIFQRLVCIDSGYSNGEFKDMKTVDMAYAEASANRIANAPFFIGDGQMTISQIEARARELKRKNDLRYLFVDYIGLVGSENKFSREQQIAEISRRLKQLANALDITVFPLSQLSRAVEKQENKRPNLSDLRDSGSIEQDADSVIMLYRPAYYATADKPCPPELENVLEIWVRKNRSGFTTDVTPVAVNYDLPTNRVWNMDEANPFTLPPSLDKPSINAFNYSGEPNF